MSKPRSREIDYDRRVERKVHGFSTAMHFGKQSKHLEYVSGDVRPRSVVTLRPKVIQHLIDQYAGTGKWRGRNKEKVDFRTVVGAYREVKTGLEVETTWVTIHYSKTGCHIVPALPDDYRR